MFFFARNWDGASWAEPENAAVSLGLFAGHPADSERSGSDFFSELASPRGKPRPGWKVAQSPSGHAAMLCGWIDNAAELQAELSLKPSGAAQLYAAAVERWGMQADRRIIGHYAAIVCLPDGRVRLARSPWSNVPIFYHVDRNVLLAATIPRPIFAAGLAKRLRPDAVDRLLTLELPEEEHSAFQGVETVPQGSILLLDRHGRKMLRWYDPLDIPEQRFTHDGDYVEAANALLSRAVSCALQGASKPGIMLSGGLDSSMVCDEALRQLPAGQKLPSFTFHPLPEWDGAVSPHKFGDDRPLVEAFAASHPRLDPHFTDNRGITFDDRAAQIYAASDAGYPARVSGSVYHGVMDAARDHGCDWLLTSDAGNLTFSNGAPWVWTEFLTGGQWRQLWRLAANVPGDARPVYRRIIARSLMPLMPPGLQRTIRVLRHGKDQADRYTNPLLKGDGRLGFMRQERPDTANVMTVDRANNREGYIRQNYHSAGLGGEVTLGLEQVFGVRLRDPTAYRPLIEFCLGLPNDQFVRDGQTRWLARRMAQGRMPEAQRINPLYGEHNADWHARMTPRLGELRRQVESIARNPDLAAVIDTEYALHLIDSWPDQAPVNTPQAVELHFHLPAMLYVARYIDAMTGRNSY